MSPESISIVLGPVPKELSPNWSGHWRAEHAAKKKYQNETAARILERGIPASCPWERARFRAAFYFTTQRMRDEDNLNASLKCVRDVFQKQGVIVNDSGLTSDPPRMAIDREADEAYVVVCVDREE